jgi:hypothetical protein
MVQVNIGTARISKIRLKRQGNDPSAPDAGHGYLYSKADGVYFMQDDGKIMGPFSTPAEYGEIYVEDVEVDIDLPAQDTYYRVIAWSPNNAGVNGESRGTVPDASNDQIVVKAAGLYYVEYHASVYSKKKNEVSSEIQVNNGETRFPNTKSHKTTSSASAIENISGGGICALAINDTVELWVKRKGGGGAAKTITFKQATITVIQIVGG